MKGSGFLRTLSPMTEERTSDAILSPTGDPSTLLCHEQDE